MTKFAKKHHVKSGKPIAPLTRHAELVSASARFRIKSGMTKKTVLGGFKKILTRPSKKIIATLFIVAILVIAADIVSLIPRKDQTNNSSDNYYSGTQNRIEEKESPLPQPDPVEKLVADATANFSPQVAIYIKDLKTSKSYTVNSYREFPSASLYKLAVMYKTYDAIDNNQLLKESVVEALRLMITISDNDSAILLAEKLGWQNIDKLMEEEGLGQIDLISPNSPSITAKAVGDLLEKIYQGSAVSPKASEEMKQLLFAQKVNDRIPKYLPSDIKVGHKTGEFDTLRHDAGIVLGKNSHYIFVFLSDTSSPSDASETIARLSKQVYDALEGKY